MTIVIPEKLAKHGSIAKKDDKEANKPLGEKEKKEGKR